MSVDVRPEDLQASFCATLVDEWARAGVAHAVVCPGSRSTPVALALHAEPRIRVHVVHDERSGAFAALGVGLASGRPAILLTTSGTAGVHAHAAVVEAHQSSVPLVVVTANRPPELADVGAAQTIDQTRLFGPAVRWFDAPGVPDLAAAPTWRARAARSVIEARGQGSARRPGPVHLDLAFREPLVGRPDHVPPGRPDGAPWTTVAPPATRTDPAPLQRVLDGARRGLVVAGGVPGAGATALAAQLGWPLLLDARARGDAVGEGTVGAADAILRPAAAAAALQPDVVLHLGAPVASRVVNEWVAAAGALEVRVGAHGWVDPGHATAVHLWSLDEVVSAPATEPGWADRWRAVEAAAQGAIDATLAREEGPTEVGTARALIAGLTDGTHVVLSSSMPVRDVEWYAAPRSGVVIHANRGANGIDGVVSTALGVALATRAPTVCLIGDVAFLHDSSALVALRHRDVDLTLVVVDNDGGGIFSFLPQSTDPGGAAFEELFGTPHGTDIPALAAAHGIPCVDEAGAGAGVRLVHVCTDRAANVDVHRRINAAVAAAVAGVL